MSMKRKAKSRIFTRTDRYGVTLYYGDFRDLGGGREALKPSGQARGRATSDPDTAEVLCARRVEELTKKRIQGDRQTAGIEKRKGATLAAFAKRHLELKAKTNDFTLAWLTQCEMHLQEAVDFFTAGRELASITAEDIESYIEHLSALSNGRSGKLSGNSQRKYLNSLSNLYRRAMSKPTETAVTHNPVAACMDKPKAAKHEARWLEIHDASLFLEAARTYKPRDIAMPFVHALIATYLLTGGRETKVLGLEVGDVNFQRRTVTFRANKWRRLKTLTSARPVPLWPQLEEILREHIRTRAVLGGLLFPSVRSETPRLITDVRKALDAIGERIGWKPGEVRTKAFRHTYCATRLQTLDRGEPVSVFTVARELGHGGDSLVKAVYGHLGTVRQRSEHVEYRVDAALAAIGDEQVRDQYAERLRVLRAG